MVALLVDISDALSERDRVRFTVHTRTKLPQFSKPVLSVVRQHEEFIWLHDCLCENDQYAGYIIPPPPPKPNFDSSREKLQRLGDCEANLSKEEFAKMKQELEAEYLAIFKKTVAMHEIFLQRLAAHEKFREDNNFKIFLEYENELAVRGKSKREILAGSLQNIGKSLTDFVITSSQVANSSSLSNIAGTISGGISHTTYNNNGPTYNQASNISRGNNTSQSNDILGNSSETNDNRYVSSNIDNSNTINTDETSSTSVGKDDHECTPDDRIDEQYFEKERLFLALYHNSIKETALCADRVTQAHKSVANSYSHMAQQLIKLASIEILPITSQSKNSSHSLGCSLPSSTSSSASTNPSDYATKEHDVNFNNPNDKVNGDNSLSDSANSKNPSMSSCAIDHTSQGLKKLLINMSDYLEQARKIETRIASDEDLKLSDTLLYYKRDTVAAQELLMRRSKFMSEYENATKNLEKASQKGRTAMQYADVIQKQAKENFLSISKLAKQELIEYKKRRVASFKKAFTDIAELEVKHLKSHSQLITNCLNACKGLTAQAEPIASTSNQRPPK